MSRLSAWRERARVPRPVVLTLAVVIILLPAVIAFADQYIRDGQSRVIHLHTGNYTVYNAIAASGMNDRADSAVSDWRTKLDNRDTVAMTSVGSQSQAKVQLRDPNLPDTGAAVLYNESWHQSSLVDVRFDSSRAPGWSADEKQRRACDVLGNVLGLDDTGSSGDCMETGSTHPLVSSANADLVDAFYGPNPSLSGSLYTQADDLHGTQTYGLDATATGHAVTSIEVKIDGTRIPGGFAQMSPCDGKCTVSMDHLTVDAGDLSDGTHTLTGIATNQFGQSDATTVNLRVDYPFFGYSDRWSTDDFDPQSGANNDPIEFAQDEGANVVRYAVNWNEVGAGAGDDSNPDCDAMPGAWKDLDDTYESLTGELPCGDGAGTGTADPPIRPVLYIRGAPLAYRRTCSDDYENALVANNQGANDHWRGFAYNVARRYPDVKGIEVWNEPNLADHWGGCDVSSQDAAERYAQLLQLAYEGIQAGHADTSVIFGALFPWESSTTAVRANWTDYRTDVFGTPSSSLDGHHVYGLFDKFGLHPYRSLVDQNQQQEFAESAREDVEDARTFLTNHNANDKQVWVTEVGATTGDDGAKEVDPEPPLTLDQVQAQKLRQIYNALRDENVPVAVFYRLSDVDTGSEPPGFGVLRLPSMNFAKKAAYYCLAQARGEGGSCP